MFDVLVFFVDGCCCFVGVVQFEFDWFRVGFEFFDYFDGVFVFGDCGLFECDCCVV